MVHVYWHCIKAPTFVIKSDDAAVKCSLKLWDSKGFLKLSCSIFSFLKMAVINKYDQKKSHFSFLCLFMQQ